MTKAEVVEALLPILRRNFPETTHQFSESTTANDVIGWDSMAHVGLMADVEDAFDIRLEPEEMMEFKTVGELAGVVAKKLDAK